MDTDSPRYTLDLKIEPAQTIGLVDTWNDAYYFISGQTREANYHLALKIAQFLNTERA